MEYTDIYSCGVYNNLLQLVGSSSFVPLEADWRVVIWMIQIALEPNIAFRCCIAIFSFQ